MTSAKCYIGWNSVLKKSEDQGNNSESLEY